MIDFTVDEEVERGPDDGEIVVDADEGIVDALFDLGGSRTAHTIGEGVGGHLARFAVAHQYHVGTWDEGLFDRGGVAFGHTVEHRLDRSEDGLLFRCLGVKRNDKEARGHCGGEEAGQRKYLHGS